MSAEEAADLLASLADNEPEVASVRRSGRSRRVSVDDNEKTPEQPRKHAKKTSANGSNKKTNDPSWSTPLEFKNKPKIAFDSTETCCVSL